MGGIKLTVHPLFFLFGVYYALTGRIFIFLIYTLSSVIHEMGHSFSASLYGYKLGDVTLMPFGAIVKGNISGLKPKDEIVVAISGPLTNLFIALFFIALWWIVPETYAYTDTVVTSNLSLAIINLLPAYPLDGGRVLSAFLKILYGEKRAVKICKISGLILGVLTLALFIVSLFSHANYTILFFALFIIFGVFSKKKGEGYIRLYTGLSEQNLMCGVEYKKQALSINASVKQMLKILDVNAVNEIVLIDKDKPVCVLSQDKIKVIIESGNIYAKIGEVLKDITPKYCDRSSYKI